MYDQAVEEMAAVGEPAGARPLRQRLAYALTITVFIAIVLGVMWWVWSGRAGRVVVTVGVLLLVETPVVAYLVAPRWSVQTNARLTAPGSGPKNAYQAMP